MSPESAVLGMRASAAGVFTSSAGVVRRVGYKEVPRRGANRPGRGPHLLRGTNMTTTNTSREGP